MLATALVALDSTVIATAIPTITKDLGGFSQFPWLLSVYLLAQAATTPLYGKVADMLGRKPVMMIGIAVFLVGSVLCALAWSMPSLIAFRAVQGLGAGAILPMSMTIVGDIYSLQERAKVQGYVASVWGVSAVVGPLIGGAFSQWVSWRWIFWVNVPLCLVAGVILWRNFREKVERRRHRIDYLGAILVTAATTLIMLGLLEGGEGWAWLSATSVVVLGAGAALVVAFVLVERRAPEPVLPLWVFGRRALLTTSLASLGVGAVMIGFTSYVPTFTQVTLGTGALIAGFSVATMTVGWPIAAAQSGRIYLRHGFRVTALIGSAITVVGAVLMLLLGTGSTPWEVGAFCLVVGAGLGLTAPPTQIAAQNTVGWSERGVVTSATMFARSIGSALGVAVYGAIVNASLGSSAGHPAPGPLADAVHDVFVGVLVAAVGMALAVFLMPRDGAGRADRETVATEAAEARGGAAG
ncbi:MDR family MFS transporter [Luteimicrobium subarcticum]|nr:MDR family MFS transporter [Luteimicrobium subarcticum]